MTQVSPGSCSRQKQTTANRSATASAGQAEDHDIEPDVEVVAVTVVLEGGNDAPSPRAVASVTKAELLTWLAASDIASAVVCGEVDSELGATIKEVELPLAGAAVAKTKSDVLGIAVCVAYQLGQAAGSENPS